MLKQVHNFLKEEAVGLGAWVFGQQMRLIVISCISLLVYNIDMINVNYAPEKPTYSLVRTADRNYILEALSDQPYGHDRRLTLTIPDPASQAPHSPIDHTSCEEWRNQIPLFFPGMMEHVIRRQEEQVWELCDTSSSTRGDNLTLFLTEGITYNTLPLPGYRKVDTVVCSDIWSKEIACSFTYQNREANGGGN
ncbi:MAG: hypothetical protein ACOCXT_06710 [Candidatus Dojkabacteria bacterium]